MNLKEQIAEDLKSAMKAKIVSAVGILRVLKGEIERNEQNSSGKVVLSESDIIKIVKKMIDGIKESNGSADEILVLERYLPKQMTEQEIKDAIKDIKNELGGPAVSIKQMGQVMKMFSAKFPGMADGKTVSNIVKEALTYLDSIEIENN